MEKEFTIKLDRDNINDISLKPGIYYEINLVDFSASAGYNKVMLHISNVPLVWYENSPKNQERSISILSKGDSHKIYIEILDSTAMKWVDIMGSDIKFVLTLQFKEDLLFQRRELFR